MPREKIHWLALIFLLSGVGVMTARTGQQGGMYLFLFLVPLSLAQWSKDHRDLVFKMGLAGFCLYATFDVIDFIHLAASGMAYRIPGDVLTKSKFSSILGVSSVCFMVIGKGKVGRDEGVRVGRAFLLAWFIDGLALGSALLGAYGVVQFLTGFDFSAVASYRPDRVFGGGALHRISGMSTHPLSLAGLSLGLLVFCGMLSQNAVAARLVDAVPTFLAKRNVNMSTRLLLAACCHGLLIAMSGSRTATGLALAFALGYGISVVRRHWGNKRVRAVAALLAIGIVAILYRIGIVGRISEFFTAQHGGDQRTNFWRVHWAMFLDSPWIGQGRYFLESTARDKFYDQIFPGQDVQRYNAHNIFLEVLAMGGVLGVGLLAACCAWFWRAFRNLTAEGGDLAKALRCPMAWAIVANALHGLTQNTFFDSAVLATYMYVVWLAVCCVVYPTDVA